MDELIQCFYFSTVPSHLSIMFYAGLEPKSEGSVYIYCSVCLFSRFFFFPALNAPIKSFVQPLLHRSKYVQIGTLSSASNLLVLHFLWGVRGGEKGVSGVLVFV